MFFNKIVLSLLIASIFATGCTALKDLASIQKPKITVTDFKISDISLRDIELIFDVEIDNPNAVAINLASYNFDFLINESSFVKGNQPLATEIKSNASTILQIPVSFTFDELFKTFSSIRDDDETGYDFRSTIGVNVPVLGLTEIPLEKSGTFPVVKPPKISASKLKVKNLSFTKADLELELSINNPNSFGISLNNLNYNVDINGLESISGTTSQKIDLSSKENNSISIPVSFNLIQLGRSAYQLLKNDDPLDYSLSGNTNLDTSLPYFKASDFNFNRSGSLNIFN
ncbi:MAG: LEA type 2 family protein [Balneola sp.]